MKKYNLEFCFKGSRTYVQGPDIFDAVLVQINENFTQEVITDIKYSAHEMLLANANVVFTKNFHKDDFDKINSIITFKVNNEKITAIVVENNNKITCTNDYSEDIVRNNSRINGKAILFKNTISDSLTEIIVSMNKYYLQKTVTKDGKWIVTKFEYMNLADIQNISNKELHLELTNNFNNKLTKSKILVDNVLVGYLYFSLI